MSELHMLDVGRADCSILLLDTEDGKKTVVIDGGELSCRGRQPLLEFLEERSIREIDLLILTHLHQDHFGGFHQLIGRVAVRRAVAPCGDLVFHEKVYPLFGDREFYREYHRIFQYFRQSGTELAASPSCWGKSFAFGESALRCLYPRPDSPMRSVRSAQALCAPELTDSQIHRLLELHKRSCNEDSSIWLLEHRGNPIALFTGDSTDETLRRALETSGPVHPEVQKLSHHGIGQPYFSEETQKMILPKNLVVSVDKTYYNEDMRITVEGLAAAGASRVHYTFQGAFAFHF
ncbi:MBL fold metallo-hydrolase [uncultured Oscillibacter sp.]|uniref:ComEC/Rec2 family competence protein n=1 Tax=uncultured Oscillibacter sp. TaxID=876091 RepID=UPI0025D4C691|nr:MBL fold metallo-hydrolase [uncultured Oscillibacter sp.]